MGNLYSICIGIQIAFAFNFVNLPYVNAIIVTLDKSDEIY